MLDTLRESYFKKTTQFIVINREMIVVASDNCLFHMSTGMDITDFHPFFFSLSELFESEEGEAKQKFYCIQFDILGKTYYIDIETHKQNPTELVIVLNNLTDHYKSVHQIKQVRNESIIGFNITQELNKELEVQRGFKNKFLANVSHEIRTPLNSILGFVSVLENTDISKEQLDILSIIKTSSKNLVTILDDLMDISKIEAGKLEIKNRRFNFLEFIETLGKTYKIRAEDKRLELLIEINEKLPRFLVGDHLRINQIVVNLLENAIKYTHQGSISFKVYTNSVNARRIPVTFEVTDTGVGMPKDKLESIFDSFTQLEKKGLFGGSGLGLSIVKQLTHLLDSDLEVNSEEGVGTTFKFTIHMGVSHNQKKEPSKNVVIRHKTKGKGKKPRILLGEDIEVNQMLMMKLFTDHGGYSLDVAKDGERVLKFLDNYHYDLVIMDITMPRMDGLDTTVHIRNHPNKKIAKLPVIALTARSSEEHQQEAKEVGVNAYLTKPIDTDLLFSTVDKYLNRYKRKPKDNEDEEALS